MTFEQIVDEEKMYVNKNGVVFTLLPELNKIMMRYNIDSDSCVGLLTPVPALNVPFKSPAQVNYLNLYKIHGCNYLVSKLK